MNNKSNRIVVTGLGTVTPYGVGVKSFWEGIKNGKSCISDKTTLYDRENNPIKICGQYLDFDPTLYLDPKEAKRLDRYIQFALIASDEAVKDAGITAENTDSYRFGVIVGSGSGGLMTMQNSEKDMLFKGPARCTPFTVPMMIVNMAAGMIGIRHQAKGKNFATVSACATGGHSIGEAARTILYGDADVMIAGGSEAAICDIGMGAFCAARTLSKNTDNPEKASRPFDKDRNGFIMSEGAGLLVLESLEHAQKRGAKIYAELIGYGTSCDAYNMVAPEPMGEGAAKTMMNALNDAGIKPEDVDYINTHGTSTCVGDVAEIKGILKVFGDYALSGKLAISSTKSMHGHALGAAGGIEAVACVEAMQNNIVPPTINLDNLDEEIPKELNLVPHKAQNKELNIVMSNSFGFGGQNVSLIFKKFN
ncbi:MAG: beta-ketoacyl-ACP synthase II [Candidatus Gastranaerophilales bacterium]|nr:beta-ketoacyl-ACP synthase II [Candidatus Gastranaerophilales bacterium]